MYMIIITFFFVYSSAAAALRLQESFAISSVLFSLKFRLSAISYVLRPRQCNQCFL